MTSVEKISRNLKNTIRTVTANGDLATDAEVLTPEFLEKNVPKEVLALITSELGRLYLDSVKKISKINKQFPDLKLEIQLPSNEKIIALLHRRNFQN